MLTHTVNGVSYRYYFKHYQSFELEPEDIDFMLNDAYNLGQIDSYDRQSGYDIDVFFSDAAMPNGVTVCIIEDQDRRELARGYSFCGPSDQFNKAIGRKISLNRALRELELEMLS